MTDTSPPPPPARRRRAGAVSSGRPPLGNRAAAARARREADGAGGVRVVGGAAIGPRPRRHPGRGSRARTPGPRATCTPRCWCSAPAPAATPPRSAPPTSARQVVMVDSRGPLGGVCLNVGCIPSQSPAARRQGHRRNQGDDPRRAGLPRPHHRPGCPARLERRRRHPAHRRPHRPGQTTQSPNPGRHRHLHLTEHALRRRPGRLHHHRVASTPRSSPPAPNRCTLPFIPHDDPRVIDSTGALDLEHIPERLLVLGGGIIGLEMATRLLRTRHRRSRWSS